MQKNNQYETGFFSCIFLFRPFFSYRWGILSTNHYEAVLLVIVNTVLEKICINADSQSNYNRICEKTALSARKNGADICHESRRFVL